jgi:hypothetical protein
VSRDFFTHKGDETPVKPYRDIFSQLLLRLVFALPLVLAGWYLVASRPSGWPAAPVLLVAMACFIGAGFLMAGPVARLFAEPAGTLYQPTATPTALKPDYSVVSVLKGQGKYADALAEYRRISDRHPGELEPYVEMIDIALRYFKDEAMAREVLAQGLARLSEASDRETLETMLQMGLSETFGSSATET